MIPRRRVSYVLPAPAEPLPLLQLPAGDAPRNGQTGPLLVRAQNDAQPTTNGESAHPAAGHPKHRLGVASLALDAATHLVGRNAPGGILYSGGRDGLIMSWDLGLSMRARTQRYGAVNGIRRLGGRWEGMTGWGDDTDEEEDVMDGDVLGEVSGARRRRLSHADDDIPLGEQWEPDLQTEIQVCEERTCSRNSFSHIGVADRISARRADALRLGQRYCFGES
jgi:WD repeat-containing protein 48